MILFEKARPEQLREELARAPVAFLPVGALEWHGEHLPLGLDGLKARALCEAAARLSGGVVFPPLFYGAIDTMPFPYTLGASKKVFRPLLRATLSGIEAMGFRAVVALTGHYPPSLVKLLKKECARVEKRGRVLALGVPEQAFAIDMGYYGDHAGMWETSIMLDLAPELARLEAMPRGKDVFERLALGVMGKDPAREASAEIGRRAVERISTRLAQTVTEVLRDGDGRAFRKVERDYARAFRPRLGLWSVAKEALDIKSPFELVTYFRLSRRKSSDRK